MSGKNAKQSHNLSVGIVGLPNSGKSSLFNSLTKNAVPAENYPFCTIDKNIGVIKVDDTRLDALADVFDAQKKVNSAITFVDIAGLVRGASLGEGLGNQFLSHIREVDMILFVLRAFEGSDITHVYERIDPYDDFKIVMTELILKDIETVDKRLANLRSRMKSGSTKEEQAEFKLLNRIRENFEKGIAVVDMGLSSDERDIIYELFLLTNKPYAFVLNTQIGGKNLVDEFINKIDKSYKKFIVQLDIKTLCEVSVLTEEDLIEYTEVLGDDMPAISSIIDMVYKRLNLITFFTGSKKEVNAWSIVGGVNIRIASSVIHTDLMANFISADVCKVADIIKYGSFISAREKGVVHNVGKEYIVNDGDYVIINVGR